MELKNLHNSSTTSPVHYKMSVIKLPTFDTGSSFEELPPKLSLLSSFNVIGISLELTNVLSQFSKSPFSFLLGCRKCSKYWRRFFLHLFAGYVKICPSWRPGIRWRAFINKFEWFWATPIKQVGANKYSLLRLKTISWMKLTSLGIQKRHSHLPFYA